MKNQEFKQASPAEEWGSANARGRQLAAETIEKMRETGDITLLIGELRKIEGPLYNGVGVGFLTYVASCLASN